MAKGASIQFKSYQETVPKLLGLMKLQTELKKYDKIVLKPTLSNPSEKSTPKEFTEAVLRFVLEHKNPVTEVFIAEGADGIETEDLFQELGYRNLAERYGVSLIDLNNTETEEIALPNFLKFSEISYPSILKNSFLISIPKLAEDEETEISASLSGMLGAFPASQYSGFFSKGKNKIRKWPIKYSIHDILRCKAPDFAIIDASSHGLILAGLPFEIDKQSAKLLGKDWKAVSYLNLLNTQFTDFE